MSTSLLTILSFAWFILYWLFGGVFFSIIGFLRIGRLQKARFGCFFSLAAFGTGVLSAWAGIQLMFVEGMRCFGGPRVPRWQMLIDQFSCGIIPILSMFVAGFILLLLIGGWLLLISTRQDVDWIATPEELPPDAQPMDHAHAPDHGHEGHDHGHHGEEHQDAAHGSHQASAGHADHGAGGHH